MASDIDDDAELIPNYSEARDLAYFKRGTSNLARAYIGLHDIVRDIIAVMDNEDRTPEEMLLLERANHAIADDDGGRIKPLGTNDAEHGMKP